VFLVLEATIGFNKRDEDKDAEVTSASVSSRKTEADFKVNAQDVKFLKSLKISVEE